MKPSVWPSPSRDVQEIMDLARYPDGSAWFGMWLADHQMIDTGDLPAVGGHSHDCWVPIPAVAALTRCMGVGSLVTPTSVHHAALLANRARTADHVSVDRIVLGLGVGWQKNEHTSLGFELVPPG